MGTSLYSIPNDTKESTSSKLIYRTKGLVAYGNRTENGVVVFKGSQAVLEDIPSAKIKKGRHYMRCKSLIEKGVLTEEAGHYVFHVTMSSPARAWSCLWRRRKWAY